jgi:hypothetical protein
VGGTDTDGGGGTNIRGTRIERAIEATSGKLAAMRSTKAARTASSGALAEAFATRSADQSS